MNHYDLVFILLNDKCIYHDERNDKNFKFKIATYTHWFPMVFLIFAGKISLF